MIARSLPFVLSLPHNSDRIPEPIRPSIALSGEEIWESMDVGTEEIFGGLPTVGAVRAQWCRLVVDVNRGSQQRGSRGVIPRVDYRGRSVYRDGMDPRPDEMDRRINRYYRPYHAQLRHVLSASGHRGMFDCHSLWGIGPAKAPDTGETRPDIVLGNNGDRSGNPAPHRGPVTCPPKVFHMMAEMFRKSGFTVSLNHPYAGGFITAHYGRELAAEDRFAVQIEINQDLYTASGEQRLLSRQIEQIRNDIFQSLDHIAANL